MKKSSTTLLVLCAACASCSGSESGPAGSSGDNAGGSAIAALGGSPSGGPTQPGGAGRSDAGGGSMLGAAGGAKSTFGGAPSTNGGGASLGGGSARGGSGSSGDAAVVSTTSGVGGKSTTGGSWANAGATAKGGTGNGYGDTTVGATGGSSSTTGNSPQELYVSPLGDDATPGTFAAPLKTIAKARDLVRTMTTGMKSDITVYLRGGTYPQSSTLTFTNADSGTGGYSVKYLAYAGERPLITGGKAIAAMTLADAANNIYSANAGTTAFRQLYVNGKKAIPARSPNLGTNSTPAFNRLSGWDKAAHNVQVPAAAVATWKNLSKVEMHVNIAWGDSTMRIASITTSGSTAYVKFQSDEAAHAGLVSRGRRVDRSITTSSSRGRTQASPTDRGSHGMRATTPPKPQ